ncbi:DUF308 domain-containing protein [Silvibacterium acidisoli]|uniref:DUF308 domain-containing protein n=1 Tax=Acidobacteriaceae bacterium ZG23-2 TaxID=2883246 RepID=UPI00406CA06C
MRRDRLFNIGALTTCGLVSVGLGFTLYQFRDIPQNIIFEVLFVGMAIEVGFAGLLLAAIVDALLLLSSRGKTVYQSASVALAAAFFSGAAIAIFIRPETSLTLLLWLSATYAAIRAAFNLTFAFRRSSYARERISALLFGIISLIFAPLLVISTRLEVEDKIVSLATYVTFLGIKLLYYAWTIWKISRQERPYPSGALKTDRTRTA